MTQRVKQHMQLLSELRCTLFVRKIFFKVNCFDSVPFLRDKSKRIFVGISTYLQIILVDSPAWQQCRKNGKSCKSFRK